MLIHFHKVQIKAKRDHREWSSYTAVTHKNLSKQLHDAERMYVWRRLNAAVCCELRHLSVLKIIHSLFLVVFNSF